jgi:CBS domain-containing protein
MSAMATAAPSIALSGLAARFCANRGSVSSSGSMVAMIPKVGLRGVGRVRAAGESVDVDVKRGDVLPSGEWPENFSMLNYEDLSKYYEDVLFKPEAQPSTHLADVMSKTIVTASPDQALEEIDHHFANISGVPVVDSEHRCVGVLSKKDRAKASDLKAKVKDVMSAPAITLSANKIVSDAAILMLKNKIHRIPIVNDSNQVVGIVTRTDIFSALEGGSDKN